MVIGYPHLKAHDFDFFMIYELLKGLLSQPVKWGKFVLLLIYTANFLLVLIFRVGNNTAEA